MALAIPFGLVQKIIERLGSTAFKEIGSIWGVKDELEKLKNSISTIQAVLLDAEEQQDKNHQVEDWLMKLRDAVYDADDLLSYFSTEELRRKVMGGDEMAKKVRTFFSSSNQLTFGHKMNGKIKVIRGRLDAIASDRNKFQFVERPSRKRVVTRERDQSISFDANEIVFGRDAEKEAISDMLLNIDEKDQNVSFISIVGIGGLGKTTLARCVYNDERVKTYFDLKMWVCISDVFDVKTIAEKIIESATKREVENLEMEQVQITLHEKLDQKKYLLVLDDVWNQNREEWSKLKGLLIGGSKGSKVVITTRSRLVAKITSTVSSSYFLEGLSKDESWSLFKQMAFEDGQVTIDSKLEEIGMGILEKCCGVPLAIKMIGSLLYSEETEDWSKFKDQELTNVTEEEYNILPVLKLSYDNLPPHLKCCFAYCSLFPKDFEIPKSMLIQLWIAQGFIQSSDATRQLEDVADKYCMDLYWRSFFEEVEKDDSGNIISFKMHDLIHDIAQAVSKIECTYFDFNAKVVDEKVRHLSFPSFRVLEDGLSSLVKAKKIRTFLKFEYSPRQEELSLKKLISNFRCLRVLDLSCLNFVTVPNSINKLTYLKYLDLSDNDIEGLPNSFVRLLNLQILKLSNCEKLKELPRDIQKLVSLKHLEIDGCKSLTHVPCGIVQLTSLQTLILSRCEKLKELPRDVQKLVNLKHLEIDESLTHMSCGLWHLTSLQTLKLYGKLKELPKDIQNLVSLKHFEINRWGSLTHMPYGIGQLNSLQTLPLFVVSKDLAASSSKNHGGLGELNKLNNLRGKLCIKNLAWVTDATSEAKAANLKEKRHLRSLELSWDLEDNNDTYVFDDENLLEGLQPHHSLKKLKVEEYRGVSFPSWLPSLTSLVKLKISNSMCQHLSPLCQLPSLRKLVLVEMIGLEYMTDREITDELSASTTFFPSLKSLELWYCPNLKGWWRRDIVDAATMTSISSEQYQQHISLPSFPCLSDLYIRDCNNLTCMPLFPYLEENVELINTSFKPLQETMAMTMNMSATSSLSSSSSSSPPLSKLKSLTLEGIQDVESLPEELLQNLASLESLTIRKCHRLKSQPRIMQHLTSLKKLDIGELEELDLFSDDGTQCVTTLQQLYISDCPNVSSLPEGIGNLTSLQRLEICKFPNLNSLPEGIGSLTSLQFLYILDCPNVSSLPEGIGNLTSLQRLEICKFPNLNSLPEVIDSLTSFQFLCIQDCPNLTSLPEGIGSLTSLWSLTIGNCPNLTSLPEGIGSLTSLKRLRIRGCPNLISLPEGIGNLTSLQKLVIINCPHLKERCQEGIGEDWHKIAHIPDVQYWVY